MTVFSVENTNPQSIAVGETQQLRSEHQPTQNRKEDERIPKKFQRTCQVFLIPQHRLFSSPFYCMGPVLCQVQHPSSASQSHLPPSSLEDRPAGTGARSALLPLFYIIFFSYFSIIDGCVPR